MEPKKDIYDYSRRLKAYQQKLEKSEISKHNKDLIRDFDRACFLEALTIPRRIKLIGSLIILAQRLGKDFDQVTKDDLKDIVMKIEGRDDY